MIKKEKKISRLAEISVAGIALLMLSPLFLLVFFLIKVTSKGPAVFRQKRVGLEGTVFTIYKFRTMRIVSSGALITARGDARITRVGSLLRKTKIDELPQLVNIFLGDMTFVGPRPEVPEYVDLKNPLWSEALKVKPGLTDPVMILLKDEESLMESAGAEKETFYRQVLQPFKLKGHIQYARRRTWCSDIRVLFQTFLAVFLPQKRALSIEEMQKKLIYSPSAAE